MRVHFFIFLLELCSQHFKVMLTDTLREAQQHQLKKLIISFIILTPVLLYFSLVNYVTAY